MAHILVTQKQVLSAQKQVFSTQKWIVTHLLRNTDLD